MAMLVSGRVAPETFNGWIPKKMMGLGRGCIVWLQKWPFILPIPSMYGVFTYQGTRKGVPRSRTCTTMVFIVFNLGVLGDYNP